MTYPSVAAFRAMLLAEPLEMVVQQHIFRGIPFVFRQAPHTADLLYNHLCTGLGTVKDNVTIVGSARIGFSLSPDTYPRRFSDSSDIDVAVVDESIFDEVWMTMLAWHYPRRRIRLNEVDWSWTKQRRNDLYWGWFTPDKIRFDGLSLPSTLKPVRDLSSLWFNTFQSLSRHREFAGRRISGRLYRTWHHAQLYHVDGQRQIKDMLYSPQQ